MILYFSATGNTQYAAQRIAEATKDTVVSIRDCMREGRKVFHLQENENFGSEAVRVAEKAGLHLDATFRIRMVDNWNPYFDMTDKEYIDAAEQRAETDLAEVCASVAAKEKGVYLPDSFDHKQEEELAVSYEESRKTQLFKVNDSCVGCGVCAAQCPVGAIEVQNKKPVWVKEKCLLCLGCVHKCPMNAIAYTDDTIGHGQYTNSHISEIV